MHLQAVRSVIAERAEAFLTSLEELVNMDSGSDDIAGVDRVGDRCAARLEAAGWSVSRVVPDGPTTGAVVVARRPGDLDPATGRRILLMAHLDTVFPAGTATARRFRIEGDRAYGPGVADDKDGVLAGIVATEALLQHGFTDFHELVFVLSPDEEIGSSTSRPVIQRLAAEADVVLNLESGRANGAVVSARKGVADLLVEIDGRAAHAGVEPEKGVNAALEAAHKIVAIQALNGRWPGVTCNVGVVRAGSRPNVVAERATLEVDVRAWTLDAFAEAVMAIEEIADHSTVEGATATVKRVHEHVPMERTDAIAELVAVAQEVAADLGFDLPEASTGGAADANTAAAVGTPVLDGLAPVGGDAHAATEWLDITSIEPRLALLAGLIVRLGRR